MAGESDQTSTYTSGSTYTIPDGMGLVFLDPTSAIAALNATLPPNPPDQFRLRIVPGGSITTGTVITLLTLTPNTGQGLIGFSTSIFTVGGSILLVYRTALAKWYRIQ